MSDRQMVSRSLVDQADLIVILSTVAKFPLVHHLLPPRMNSEDKRRWSGFACDSLQQAKRGNASAADLVDVDNLNFLSQTLGILPIVAKPGFAPTCTLETISELQSLQAIDIIRVAFKKNPIATGTTTMIISTRNGSICFAMMA